jgi:glycosyltransferase involved in cell wall biosynthesis
MLLTLAIPTYKSNDTLQRLISSICRQSDNQDFQEIEVVISDNNPDSQALSDVIEKVIGCNIEIRYHRNEVNLGYDGNLTQLVAMARGKYIKFIADDDTLGAVFVKNHCNLLRSTNPDIVVNDFQTYKGKSLPLIEFSLDSNFETFSPPWNLNKLDSLRGRFGQVSSLTFRLDQIRDMFQEYESNFIHLFWFYSLLEKSRVVFESNPQIYVQLGSPNFSSNNLHIMETQLVGLRSIKFANLIDSNFKRDILKRSQDYSFGVLRLLPELTYSQRRRFLWEFRSDFFARPGRFSRYIVFILMPKTLKMWLRLLINRQNFKSKID